MSLAVDSGPAVAGRTIRAVNRRWRGEEGGTLSDGGLEAGGGVGAVGDLHPRLRWEPEDARWAGRAYGEGHDARELGELLVRDDDPLLPAKFGFAVDTGERLC